MEIVLREDMFQNNKLYVSYGANRQALFTIIDEEFAGNNRLGRINRVTCLARETAPDGTPAAGTLGCLVIGIGDGVVGVRSEDRSLWGKALTRENMDKCVVELSE
jgi:hypothetical protein